MNNILNVINNDISKLISRKEEFGILNEIRTYLPEYGEGIIQTISFNSWTVQQHTITEYTSSQKPLLLSNKSKYILFNIDHERTIEWKAFDGKNHKLTPNKGMFINHIPGAFTIHAATQLELVLIELKHNYFEQGIFTPSLQNTMRLIFDKNDRVSFTISNQITNFIKEITGPSKRGLCQFMFLNAKILEILSAITDKLDINASTYDTHPNQKQLDDVIALINTKLHIQFSINDLAKHVGLNTSYLKKYFKEAFNETIFEYASKRRMSYAQKLLSSGNIPIASITEKVGYQQAAHFSYAFKKSTGYTPIQYRKNKKIS